MKKCGKCARAVIEGDYIEFGERIECLDCIEKTAHHARIIKQKPKEVICLRCDARFDYLERECPKCRELSPYYEFNIGEFFINISIGYLAVLLALLFIMLIFRGTMYKELLFEAPIALVKAFFGSLIFVFIFFIGRWIRDVFTRVPTRL